MKLIKLTLRNFKGIKNFTLNAEGENVKIFGDNATGKTTIFDAFTWLLFGKDSQNKADFEIKALDQDGKPIHGLEHSVEATLELTDNQQLTLRKVYKEKWTKKRGSAKPTFTGHTTDHFIDGVPVKKSEYDARISNLIDEKIFKLLTSPTYFNEQIHWQERRRILLEVCGDISDQDVVTAEPKLEKLQEVLKSRTLDDHQKVIASRRVEINKELERIPIRIDEIEHNLPNISNINPEELPNDIAKLEAQLEEKQQELSRIESGGEIAEKTKKLREVEGELLEIQHQHRQKAEAGVQEKRTELNELRNEISNLQYNIQSTKRTKEGNESTITRLEDKASQLRKKWHQVNAQEFSFEQDDTCPACGQKLPQEQLKEARENALAQFNREKAKELEAITQEGKGIKSQLDTLKEENAKFDQENLLSETQLAKLQQKADALQAEIDALTAKTPDISNNPTYVAKIKEKEAIEEEIAQLKADNKKAVAKVRDEINTIKQGIEALQDAQAKVKLHEQAKQRIQELKDQEKKLAAEYERLEEELYLTEEFIRTKVKLLEEKINSKFRFARFKLFNQLVNGGVEECCETLYQGVPYGSGLNNGHKIIVGLDIIETLAEHYGFRPPIFIDNAEGVTRLPEVGSQVISLIVSEADKKLRVEVEPKTDKKSNTEVA